MNGGAARPFDPHLSIAQFLAGYGASAYWNTAHPTDDGVIPWQRFVVLYARLEHVWAHDRLQLVQATAMALAMVNGGDMDAEFQKLTSTAYPEPGR